MQVFKNENDEQFPIVINLENGLGRQCLTKSAARELVQKLAELVEEKITSTNSAMDAICTCSEAACRYRSATEPTLCLDPTDLCKSKRHQ